MHCSTASSLRPIASVPSRSFEQHSINVHGECGVQVGYKLWFYGVGGGRVRGCNITLRIDTSTGLFFPHASALPIARTGLRPIISLQSMFKGLQETGTSPASRGRSQAHSRLSVPALQCHLSAIRCPEQTHKGLSWQCIQASIAV